MFDFCNGNILEKLDLNLLKIFEVVYHYQSITKAASHLHISVPAVSQAIKRLRVTLPEPLFLREGKGMAPTEHAVNLHHYINCGLEHILTGFTLAIDNAERPRDIFVACQPHIGSIVMPKIFHARKSNELLCLSHIDLPTNEGAAEYLLLNNKADLVIDYQPVYNNAIEYKAFCRESLVVLCRKNHPRLKNSISLESYRREEHAVIINSTLNRLTVKADIHRIAPDRTISFSSHFLNSLIAVVESTDMICLFPRILAQQMIKAYEVKILQHNLTIEPPTLYVMYHKDIKNDRVLTDLANAFKNEV
ncbi:LysR family transcriptional regulator [Edaphovirga cremea]|uniref:LysR family transcriptional regulator n=1 Tax=Edaphovirga cremea TaxID=2267246 RepID=UPI001475A0BA|nr:LysR family transcriptional regulator [Edaphovirga cremea]